MPQKSKTKIELWKDFGLWLKAEREAEPYQTQEQVARRAGITTVHLSRIETGLGTKRDTVIAIAEAVGCDVGEALDRSGFGRGEVERYNSEILDEFSFALNRYHRLSEKSRKFINRHFSETINFLLDVEDHRVSADEIVSGEIPAADNLPADIEFERDYENHLRKMRAGGIERPALIVETPTQEDYDKIPRARLPGKTGNKKRLLKKREGGENY